MRVKERMQYFVGIVIFVSVLSCIATAQGQPIVYRHVISSEHVSLMQSALGTYIEQHGAYSAEKEGYPAIPRESIWVKIPFGHRVEHVTASHSSSRLYAEDIVLAAVSKPQPLSLMSLNASTVAQPDPLIYQSNKLFPSDEDLARFTGIQTRNGESYALFLIAHLQYAPLEKQLFFVDEVSLEIETYYTPDAAEQIRFRQPAQQDIQYLIITTEGISTAFEPLAAWKQQKGVPAAIKTMEWINTTYSGVDSAEKLRNCIIDAYTNWNTLYVLLGGDTEYVPYRATYAMDCQAGFYPDENQIPCDLYFAALDGTWNADADTTYGETTDSVDLLPEVYVGRAPVSTLAQAQNFVTKTILYETNPPLDFQKDVTFLSEVLWENPMTDGGISSDYIDETCFDGRFDPIQKLYETSLNLNRTAAIQAMNQGPGLINHVGHCNYMLIGVNGYLSIPDVDALTNGNRQFVFNSIGCWPAAIDKNAIAEHMLYDADGGAVGFIGNSRYGWGSPGNPCYGYSDFYEKQFWCELLNEGNEQQGIALAESKIDFIPYSADENVYRWIQYELNLLGDPELPIWTDTPQSMTVNHPESLPMGSGFCSVTVTENGTPFQNARVCLSNGSDLYVHGITDASGIVGLAYETTSDTDVTITVTAQNMIPFENQITVVASGRFLSVMQTTINDNFTLNYAIDGFAEAGEHIECVVTLKNTGTEDISDITCSLTSSDEYVTITDSAGGWQNLLRGQSAPFNNPIALDIDSDCPLMHIIVCDLEILIGGVTYSHAPLHIQTHNPWLRTGRFWTSAEASPGSVAQLFVQCKNTGLVTAPLVTAVLTTDDPYFTILDETVHYETIATQMQGTPDMPFRIEIASGCPSAYLGSCYITFTSGPFSFMEPLTLVVGASGMSETFESGLLHWQPLAPESNWQLTGVRSHSRLHSLYCGLTPDMHYVDNTADVIETEPFTLAPNSILSFWRWFRFTTYGSDGLYVRLHDSNGYHTLDYIGSGGALGDLPIVSDWCQVSYDLSAYSGQVSLQFRFVSDGADYEEGIYIDDIQIANPNALSPAPPVPAESMIPIIAVLLGISIMLRSKRF